MRRKKTAFLSCAAVAVVALLAAPAAMATGYSSSCNASPTIKVVAGPCAVTFGMCGTVPCLPSQGAPRCAGPNEVAEYTGIQYKNLSSSTSLNHVAALVTRNNEVVVPSGTQVIKDCKGDPVTELGKRTCHADAVKFNGVPASASFWFVVKGRQLPIETTVASKQTSSSSPKCFPIVGLGLTASSSQLIQQVQRVTSQDGCAVDFITDSLTGDVLSAKLTAESLTNGCTSPSLNGDTIEPLDAAEFEVFRGSESFGSWKFGEGYIRSGQNSCTTRVIGGRVYTWGDPCPEP